MNSISKFISTLCGIGYFPKAPGTMGTAFAAVLYYILIQFGWENGWLALVYTLALALVSVFLISKAEKDLGHDAGSIVIDELIGYFIAVMFLPQNIVVVISAFILFRIFDIFKPEPVKVLEKLPAGWGVMADDIMAGIYANVVLQILVRVLPRIFN